MAGWLGKNVLCVTGYDEEVAMWGGYGFGVQPRRGYMSVARGINLGYGATPRYGFRPVRADIKWQPGVFTRGAQAPDLDVSPSFLIGVSDRFRY
jgi:hypothetical protein